MAIAGGSTLFLPLWNSSPASVSMLAYHAWCNSNSSILSYVTNLLVHYLWACIFKICVAAPQQFRKHHLSILHPCMPGMIIPQSSLSLSLSPSPQFSVALYPFQLSNITRFRTALLFMVAALQLLLASICFLCSFRFQSRSPVSFGNPIYIMQSTPSFSAHRVSLPMYQCLFPSLSRYLDAIFVLWNK